MNHDDDDNDDASGDDNDDDQGRATPIIISIDSPAKTELKIHAAASAAASAAAVLTSSSNLSEQQRRDAALMPPPPPSITLTRNEDPNQFPMLGGPQRASEAPAGLGLDRIRKKKPLAPGHSPMDWAKLKSSNVNLAGVGQIGRYTLEEIATHKKRDDLWLAYNGKIYNCTRYLDFHPGGAGQLLRGAGKDATELIQKIHPWVNIDMMLDKCFIGYLVREH